MFVPEGLPAEAEKNEFAATVFGNKVVRNGANYGEVIIHVELAAAEPKNYFKMSQE